MAYLESELFVINLNSTPSFGTGLRGKPPINGYASLSNSVPGAIT